MTRSKVFKFSYYVYQNGVNVKLVVCHKEFDSKPLLLDQIGIIRNPLEFKPPKNFTSIKKNLIIWLSCIPNLFFSFCGYQGGGIVL